MTETLTQHPWRWRFEHAEERLILHGVISRDDLDDPIGCAIILPVTRTRARNLVESVATYAREIGQDFNTAAKDDLYWSVLNIGAMAIE
jgi:hypothetical protein